MLKSEDLTLFLDVARTERVSEVALNHDVELAWQISCSEAGIDAHLDADRLKELTELINVLKDQRQPSYFTWRLSSQVGLC